MPLSLQMELRRYADTKKTMDQINEALIGFVLVNGRLPCPADPNIADGTANAGVERATCSIAATKVGVIPWVTLNVAEADEWGRRFTYRVTSIFADAIAAATYGCTPAVNPTQSSFALCASGDMKVRSRNPSSKVAYDMTNVMLPAVFLSAGKNGYGAYTPQGNVYAAVPADNVDETTNASAATLAFVSRDRTDASTPCSDTAGTASMCEFDDLVAFIPLTTLMNRMVVSGKLP
ncbi:MAG: hypothetical protein ACTS6J_01795 [Burkholderiales bacterium]